MRPQTSLKAELFARALRMGILGVFALFVVLACISLLQPVHTAAAVSSTLNFQARLETAGGAIVPDGNYNVEFKLYDLSTSSGSSQGSCTGDADCLWVETRTSANQVRVVNGYLTVNLGSVNAFGTLNWNQQLWLTMRIGGTGTPSWDAEMSPRIQLTATPYSFQAGELGNGTNRATFDSSGNLVFQQASTVKELSAASGTTLTIQGGAATSGTNVGGNLLLQGGAGASTGASGSVIVKSNTNNSATAFQVQKANGDTLLTVDTGGGKVTLGTAGTIGGKLVLYSGAASNINTITITTGNTSSSYTLILPTAASGTSGWCLKDTDGAGTLGWGSCSGAGGGTLASDYAAGGSQSDSTIALDSTRLGLIVKDNATPISGSLFLVQNSGGSSKYLDVRSNGLDLLGAGNSTISTNSGNLTVSANATLSLQGGSGGLSLDATTNSINVGTSANNKTINIGAIGSTANTTTVHIGDTTGAAQTITIGSTNGSSTTTIQGGTGNVNLLTNSSSAGVIVKTSTNSATGFVVQDTSSNQIFGVDTSSAQILFGKAGTLGGKLVLYSGTASNTNTVTLTVGNTTASYTLTLPTSLPGSSQCIQSSNTGVLSFTSCGGVGTTTINLIPEYIGAVFSQYDATGTSSGTNVGFMQSDHVAGLALGQGYKHNYYQWSTDQSAAQDYHIITEYQLPTGFSSFATGTLKIWTYIDSSTSTDLKFTMYDVDGTACYASLQSIKPASAATWTQTTLSDPGNGCTFTAGDVVTIDIKMVAIQPSTNYVKVGELQFGYN